MNRFDTLAEKTDARSTLMKTTMPNKVPLTPGEGGSSEVLSEQKALPLLLLFLETLRWFTVEQKGKSSFDFDFRSEYKLWMHGLSIL